MSQEKNAILILILAGVFFVIVTAWNLGTFVIDYIDYWGYYDFDIMDFARPVLWFVASLLLMIGFIILRTGDESTSATTARLCAKCGRNISAEAKFCPYCGWKPTTGTG